MKKKLRKGKRLRIKQNLFCFLLPFLFLIGCVTTQKETSITLKEGMPNTMKLPTGEIIYDLRGEWKAAFQHSGYVTHNHTVKISQDGNKVIGVVLEDGEFYAKGQTVIKGELGKNGPINFKADTMKAWHPASSVKIKKNGNVVNIFAGWTDIFLERK